MISSLKTLYKELLEVWKIAKKPEWDEVKQMVGITLLIALFVGFIGLIIFVIIQLILQNI